MVAIVLFSTMAANASSSNNHTRTYTNEHPLIYEDCWDMYPYSFLNEQGKPDGYNIEVIKMIFEKLKIPYTIVLKPVTQNQADLNHGNADLIVVRSTGFFSRFGHYSRNSISLITTSLATPIDKPVNIHTFSDLSKQKVTILDSGMVHRLMIDYEWGANAIPVKDINEAILKVSDTEQGQVIWYKPSLEYLKRTYNLDNIRITDVDIPLGEARFVSHNQQLLNQIDSVYTLLNSEDRFEPLQNKWFYPDRGEWQMPAWAWWLMGIATLLTIPLLYSLYYFRRKDRQLAKSYDLQNQRMSLIFEASGVRMWTYNVHTDSFNWYDRDSMNYITYPAEEFSHRYYPGDFNRLMRVIEQLIDGSITDEQVSLDIKAMDAETGDNQEHDFQMQLSVLQRNKKGNPIVILGTKKDITDELRLEQDAEERLIRYKTIFDSSTIGIIVFNAEGQLTNINEKACSLFQCDKKDIIRQSPSFRTLFELEEDHIEALDGVSMCRKVDFDNHLTSKELGHIINQSGTQIFEIHMMVACDEANEHANNLLVVIEDIRQHIEIKKQWKDKLARKRDLQHQLDNYIDHTNYLLKVSGMRMVRYSPETHTLCVKDNLSHVQYELTQTRCMTLVHERSQKRVMHLLSKMDNRSQEPFFMEVMTVIRSGENPLWLRFCMTPVHDDIEEKDAYFGICYDISELKANQLRLDEAYNTAREIEHAKNSFLKNMCYEIRTPLTAVVGFAEMLSTDITPEDEHVFTKEILDNSDHLLRLIDEILFYSRIDSDMVKITPTPTEFTELFKTNCQRGWDMAHPNGVNFIMEIPYDQLVLNIDGNNIAHLLTSLISNAAFNTKHGFVRVRFDYIGRRLIISVEDTSDGISDRELQLIKQHTGGSIDERIGISLPVCKQLAEMMNGTLEISSESGQGTIVWVSIPCQASLIKRKKFI